MNLKDKNSMVKALMSGTTKERYTKEEAMVILILELKEEEESWIEEVIVV